MHETDYRSGLGDTAERRFGLIPGLGLGGLAGLGGIGLGLGGVQGLGGLGIGGLGGLRGVLGGLGGGLGALGGGFGGPCLLGGLGCHGALGGLPGLGLGGVGGLNAGLGLLGAHSQYGHPHHGQGGHHEQTFAQGTGHKKP